MKGFSTVKLIIILGLLVGVYMLISWTSDKGRSESYREELVTFNSEEVSKIVVTSQVETVTLTKEDENWFVHLSEGKKVKAKSNAASGFLSTLETIEPGAVVTKNPEKWGDFQVDSTGMQVEIYEGTDKTLDLVIGRFNMKGQNSFSTYVRLSEDDLVYSADNFMGITLGKTRNSFRESLLWSINKDSIDEVSFNYPDSSFVLSRSNGSWVIDNEISADSAIVAAYLAGLTYLNSTNFADEVNFTKPQLSVSVQSNDKTYKMEAMSMDSTFIIHTAENMDGYFVDESMFEKIFKGKISFL